MRGREPTALEKIGALIPGYVGYSDREAMRQTDKLLRMRIHDVLRDAERALQSMLETGDRSFNADQLRIVERCRKSMDTLAERFRYAPYGASGLFSDFQVKEPELEKVHKMDLEIIEQLDPLTKSALTGDFSTLSMQIKGIKQQLEARNRFFQERK